MLNACVTITHLFPICGMYKRAYDNVDKQKIEM